MRPAGSFASSKVSRFTAGLRTSSRSAGSHDAASSLVRWTSPAESGSLPTGRRGAPPSAGGPGTHPGIFLYEAFPRRSTVRIVSPSVHSQYDGLLVTLGGAPEASRGAEISGTSFRNRQSAVRGTLAGLRGTDRTCLRERLTGVTPDGFGFSLLTVKDPVGGGDAGSGLGAGEGALVSGTGAGAKVTVGSSLTGEATFPEADSTAGMGFSRDLVRPGSSLLTSTRPKSTVSFEVLTGMSVPFSAVLTPRIPAARKVISIKTSTPAAAARHNHRGRPRAGFDSLETASASTTALSTSTSRDHGTPSASVLGPLEPTAMASGPGRVISVRCCSTRPTSTRSRTRDRRAPRPGPPS